MESHRLVSQARAAAPGALEDPAYLFGKENGYQMVDAEYPASIPVVNPSS